MIPLTYEELLRRKYLSEKISKWQHEYEKSSKE